MSVITIEGEATFGDWLVSYVKKEAMP